MLLPISYPMTLKQNLRQWDCLCCPAPDSKDRQCKGNGVREAQVRDKSNSLWNLPFSMNTRASYITKSSLPVMSSISSGSLQLPMCGSREYNRQPRPTMVRPTNFTMMRKWYTFSRNYRTWNSEFCSFPGLVIRSMILSHDAWRGQPHLPVSHVITRAKNQHT